MALRSIDPTTGELIEEYEETTPSQVASILAEASCAFAGWRRTPFAERAPKMRAAADLLDARREELARLMAAEMGKPLAAGPRGGREVRLGLPVLRRRGRAASWRARTSQTDASQSFVRLRAAGRRARGHALELPLLAGLPLRGARAHGRQRGPAQARLAT